MSLGRRRRHRRAPGLEGSPLRQAGRRRREAASGGRGRAEPRLSKFGKVSYVISTKPDHPGRLGVHRPLREGLLFDYYPGPERRQDHHQEGDDLRQVPDPARRSGPLRRPGRGTRSAVKRTSAGGSSRRSTPTALSSPPCRPVVGACGTMQRPSPRPTSRNGRLRPTWRGTHRQTATREELNHPVSDTTETAAEAPTRQREADRPGSGRSPS